jgi:integrase
MKLIPRSNGIWMLEYYEGEKRVRISTGERMRDRAEAVARAMLAGTHERSQTWTLEDALKDCYDRIWSRQKSSGPHLLRVNKLIRHEGKTRIAEINYDWLVRLRDRMETWGIKSSTTNRYMAAISKALGEAHKRGKLAAMPKVPYTREPKGKLRWITHDEERVLLDKCGELWTEPEARAMRALLIFLLDTGARLTEALTVSRFPAILDGVAQVTFGDTKNGSSRTVPLTQRAWANLPTVPQWTAKLAVDRFTRLRNHCGMPDVSLHTMRHTCASRLVQGGMDLYRVMHWLGHRSITVTQRYAHLAPTSLAQGASILAQGGQWTPIGGDSSRPVPSVPRLSVVK